MAINHRAAAC